MGGLTSPIQVVCARAEEGVGRRGGVEWGFLPLAQQDFLNLKENFALFTSLQDTS